MLASGSSNHWRHSICSTSLRDCRIRVLQLPTFLDGFAGIRKRSMARKQMLRSVLEGHVKLWMHEQLTDDDRAFLGRWADDWADRAEYVPLWEQLERDVKTGRVGGGAFQELIRCALEARRFASNSEREIDPDFEQKQHRRQELLKLAEMARALADHFREESINASWMRDRDTILMPLVKDIQYRRLSDDHQASFLDLPFAYELVVPAHVLRQLHERESEALPRTGAEGAIPPSGDHP